MRDPTAADMRQFLASQLPPTDECNNLSVAAAIYWFANNYHGGQASNLYSALSTSQYKPSILASNIYDEDDDIQFVYDLLIAEYQTETPA